MALKSVHKNVLYQLGKHLKQFMPSITDVLHEFPDPAIELSMPALSITLGNPVHSPLDPYVHSQDAANGQNRAKVRYVTGMFDYQIQIDIWCRDKFERFNMIEEFRQAFNPEIVPQGLSLQLVDYWGVWCRYDVIGHNIDDSEGGSQRSEWRATINLLANTREITEREVYVVKTIENNLDTSDTEIV